MARFRVLVTKKIETYVYVTATTAEEAKAVAWAHLPEHVDDWHCDLAKGTKYSKVERVRD